MSYFSSSNCYYICVIFFTFRNSSRIGFFFFFFGARHIVIVCCCMCYYRKEKKNIVDDVLAYLFSRNFTAKYMRFNWGQLVIQIIDVFGSLSPNTTIKSMHLKDWNDSLPCDLGYDLDNWYANQFQKLKRQRHLPDSCYSWSSIDTARWLQIIIDVTRFDLAHIFHKHKILTWIINVHNDEL